MRTLAITEDITVDGSIEMLRSGSIRKTTSATCTRRNARLCRVPEACLDLVSSSGVAWPGEG
jgi:hypothetical protein